ncbi:6439_t:CDS:2, partial [Racocetra fulgida]
HKDGRQCNYELEQNIFEDTNDRGIQNTFNSWDSAMNEVKKYAYHKAETILPNVCQLLKAYLTKETRKIQEDQIIQALYYHTSCISKNELQTYNSDPNLFNKNFTTIIAKVLIVLVTIDDIVEMWAVRHVIEKNIKHFVILLNNGLHLCSCFNHHSTAIASISQASMDINHLNALNYNYLGVKREINQEFIEEHQLYGENYSESDNENLDPQDLENSHKHKSKERLNGT